MSAMGVAIRHVFNLRHKGADPRATMAIAAALGIFTITYVSLEKAGVKQAGGDLAYADIQPILAKHCVTCHAPHPANPAFAAPPLGVLLDSAEHASAVAPRIKKVAVDAQVMPLGNMTNMTLEERAKLGTWIAAGAKP
ncbi:hypothetical protein KXX17_001299, partial [Aspergillus fumigatus]